MGKISITSKQAAYFEVKPYSQWSPYLEKCCLLLSANSSYEHASEDLKVLTGGFPLVRERWNQRYTEGGTAKAFRIAMEVVGHK
ncbi:MAG: hypothetical protein EBE86_026060 [Hormoscilla sp. GUM202]|nr:hypothetical protein [Hormoscilla sp. GUM202]